MPGFLHITHGPMFAGKTSNLIENINNYITFNSIHQQHNIKMLIINSTLDQRGINKIANLSTHNKFTKFNFPDNIDFIETKELLKIDVENYEYIAIDECQFYPDLKYFVEDNLTKGKYIHCAGLLADSDKKPFGQLYMLLPRADEITHLKAFCVYCKSWYKNAVFTKWIGEDKKDQAIKVGAAGSYIPVCGQHY